MKRKKAIAVVGAGLLATAGIATVLISSPQKASKADAGVLIPIEKTAIPESYNAVQMIRSNLSKQVKVVGAVVHPADAVTEDADFGKVVEVGVDRDHINALCNVVLESKNVASASALVKNLRPDSDPVMIQGSCKSGKCLWVVLLRGLKNCKAVADIPEYLGSNMRDFLALPAATKARLLRVDGTCDVIVDKKLVQQVDCSVPYGDVRARPDSKAVYVLEKFSDRDDLNFQE